MEVLHHLRPRCGAVVRRLPALLLAVAAACGGQDRQGLTADSAVLPPGPSGSDSGGVTTGTAVDTSAADSLAVDSIPVANPTVVLVADSAAGDVLFRRKGRCLSCHGLSGKGIEALGPNLQDSVWLHGDGSFAFIQRMIRDGVARPIASQIVMPSFGAVPNADGSVPPSTLSPEEIYHITAYVYALSHPGSVVADTARAVGDTLGVGTDTLLPPPPPPVALPSGAVIPQADMPTGR